MRWVDDVTPWWVGERVSCPRCGKSYELTIEDRESGAVLAFGDQFLVAKCMAGCMVDPRPLMPPGPTPPDPFVIDEDAGKVPVTMTVYRPSLPLRIANGPSTELSDDELDRMRSLQQEYEERRKAQNLRDRLREMNPDFAKAWDEAGDALGESAPTEEETPDPGNPFFSAWLDRFLRTDWPGDTIRGAVSSDPASSNASSIARSFFDADDPDWTGFSFIMPSRETMQQERTRLDALNVWAADIRRTQDPDAVFFYAAGSSMPDHLECPNLGICMELPDG